MAEHRAAPVAARQAAHELGHLLHRCQQRALAFLRVRQPAAQRCGVAPMAGVVEGHGDVAVARQRQRKGLHQLLRPGEAVRDQHHRRWRAGCGRAEHRHRRAAERQGADRHAAAGRFELPDGGDDGEQRQHGGEPGPGAAAVGGQGHRCILAHTSRNPDEPSPSHRLRSPARTVGARTGTQALRQRRCRGGGGLQRHQHRHRTAAVGRQHAALSGAGLSAGAGLRDGGHGDARQRRQFGASRRLGVRAGLVQLCRCAQHLRRCRRALDRAARPRGARAARTGRQGGAAGAGRHRLSRAVAARADGRSRA